MKDVAAFGGLLLGLLNLAITLYKEFYKKGKLSVELLTSDVRYISEGLYHFQIDIRFSAKNDSVQLKQVSIGNPNKVFGEYSYNNYELQDLRYGIKQTSSSIVRNTKAEAFITTVDSLFKDRITMLDYIIEKDRQSTLTFVGELTTFRYSDGNEDWPIDGWYIRVMYRDTKCLVPFRFNKV
ncbi:hypothetical protein LLH06_00370 [Mucilaginibacter daejeonensis]|uniref:hypothetical protein n=1 Tax=Mucilaginibacter daejeonensis TaxID=398049 RepID=UPI001D17AF89|nr:hypothetical protein [Mucilaginibacter daejeonensis]UEG53431.1 hypothetical protein LLH06_00370 [Mucilaginibacter daejeonensis]